MALTRDAVETIKKRAERDPKFFKEFLKEILREALIKDPDLVERVVNKINEK